MKNASDRLINRLDTAEEKSEFENIAIETSATEKQNKHTNKQKRTKN